MSFGVDFFIFCFVGCCNFNKSYICFLLDFGRSWFWFSRLSLFRLGCCCSLYKQRFIWICLFMHAQTWRICWSSFLTCIFRSNFNIFRSIHNDNNRWLGYWTIQLVFNWTNFSFSNFGIYCIVWYYKSIITW